MPTNVREKYTTRTDAPPEFGSRIPSSGECAQSVGVIRRSEGGISWLYGARQGEFPDRSISLGRTAIRSRMGSCRTNSDPRCNRRRTSRGMHSDTLRTNPRGMKEYQHLRCFPRISPPHEVCSIRRPLSLKKTPAIVRLPEEGPTGSKRTCYFESSLIQNHTLSGIKAQLSL
jgi:hypothetical protein